MKALLEQWRHDLFVINHDHPDQRVILPLEYAIEELNKAVEADEKPAEPSFHS